MAKKNTEIVLTPIAQMLLDMEFKNITIDEAHGFKNDKSQRSMALDKIINANNPEYIVQLTGTPFLNRPADIINNLRIARRLDNTFGGFIKFTVRYCDGHKGRFGWDFKGCTNPEELNTRMRESGVYIRREKRDVLPELPEKTRVFGSLPIRNRAAYDRAAGDLYSHIRAEARDRMVKDEKFIRSLDGMTAENRAEAERLYCINLVETAMKAEILVEMQKLETLAAEGKFEAAVECVDNFLESGKKLVIMVAQTELIAKFRKQYPKAAYIISELSGAERLAQTERFQNDPDCNLIICAMGKHAGACPIIGLNMQAASDVMFFSIGWQPGHHDQCEDRVLRIGSKNAVTCYYYPAQGTFEEEKLAVVEQKRVVTTKTTSGEYRATDADADAQLFFLTKIF